VTWTVIGYLAAFLLVMAVVGGIVVTVVLAPFALFMDWRDRRRRR
jgi:hypothetical protein